jgi:hypothetical protein
LLDNTDFATRFQDTIDAVHTSLGIFPMVKCVDGENFVEGTIGERQFLNGCEAQLNATTFDGGMISGRCMVDHDVRNIDSSDVSIEYDVGQKLNRDTRPDANFEDVIVAIGIQLFDCPCGAVAILQSHDPSGDMTKHSTGLTELLFGQFFDGCGQHFKRTPLLCRPPTRFLWNADSSNGVANACGCADGVGAATNGLNDVDAYA